MKTLPIHEIHRSLGAQFTPVLDWEVPANYGDPTGEHLAVRNRVGITDLSFRGRILITGVDRAKFLQGLLTNDVLKLTEGQGLYAAILNPKGRMLTDLKIYAIHEALLIDLDREVTDKTVQILNRYKLVAKAKMEEAERQPYVIIKISGVFNCSKSAAQYTISHLFNSSLSITSCNANKRH